MDTVYCFIAHGYNGSIQMVTLKFIAKSWNARSCNVRIEFTYEASLQKTSCWFAHEFNRNENHLANYTFAYEFTHTAIVSQNLGLRTCLPARQTWRK